MILVLTRNVDLLLHLRIPQDVETCKSVGHVVVGESQGMMIVPYIARILKVRISIDLEVTLEASFNINDFKLGRSVKPASFHLVNDLVQPHVLRLTPHGISCVQEGKIKVR